MVGDTQQKAPFGNATGFIVAAVVAVTFIAAGAFALSQKTINPNQPGGSQETNQQQIMGQPSKSLADKTLVYGLWTQGGSDIKALDLSNGAYQTLAALPSDIKKVTVLSPSSLLYINQTDNRDHGKSLAVYSMPNKKVITTIPASDGFGIDDYVVSPDHKKVAIWEVAFAPGSGILRNGKSRVYTASLDNPSTKNLVSDEDATSAVHYPRAIIDTGRVFLDTFLPNDPNGGAGWAYGMSISNFEGTDKQDLANMKNGTYGTQPVLSPDSTKLAFAGYDGSNGAGDAVQDGFRQSLLTPNTVETLDTDTLTRQKLPTLPNTNIYTAVRWDHNTGNLFVGVVSKNTDESGLHMYNLATSSLEKLPTDNSANHYAFIATLSSDTSLLGSIEKSPSALGNLGETYGTPFNQFVVLDATDAQGHQLPLSDSMMQYITLVSPDYFKPAHMVHVDGDGGQHGQGFEYIDLYSPLNAQKNNLQLYTFLLKPSLAPIRENQQSSPVKEEPGGTGGTTRIPTPTVIGDPYAGGCTLGLCNEPQREGQPACGSIAQQQCDHLPEKSRAQCYGDAMPPGSCYDSPLYLYGTEGKKVSVEVGTYVYNSEPAYANFYDITLLKEGKMQVNGTLTDSIKYDYTPGIKKIASPTYGTIVTQEQLGIVLQEYGQKLGLNKKEIDDLIVSGKNQITAPYAFVSFFNQQTSQDILPLEFSPKPDNYRNIVFYFKQYADNPSFTPQPPAFPSPLNRSGFTAVEISSLVE